MPILFLLLFAVCLNSIGQSQELIEKSYDFPNGLKNIEIDGFEEIYFEFGESTQVEVSYPSSRKSTKFSSTINGKNARFSIKQKPQQQPKTIRIIGDLEGLKTVDVSGNCKVHFPNGWEGESLKRWQNHDQVEFYYDRN